MKKQFLGLLLLCLPLFSCAQENSSEPKFDSSFSSANISSSLEKKEDFTLIGSDNGLSLSRSEYTFAQRKEGDSYYPDASIRMTADSSWRYCTALSENDTRFYVEDESVIKKEDLSLKIITKDDLGGSSNEIAAIDVVFDRAKVNAGQTKVKVTLKPGNGVSSMNVLTTLCFSLSIKRFGEIDVESYKGSLVVDTKGLDSIAKKETASAKEVTLNITDLGDNEEIYGINADTHKEVAISLNALDGGASLSDVRFAKGHKYSVFIYVGGDSTNDIVWVSLVAQETSSSFSLKEVEAGNSTLEVYEDNALVKAKLGTYKAL